MKLAGGLGNQLFQYACGRSLAQKYQSPLTLDISFYHRNLWRRRLGEALVLGKGLIKPFRFTKTLKQVSNNRRLYNLDKFNLIENIKLIKDNPATDKREQDPFIFDRKIMQAGDRLVYEGYFNSYKYFKDIEAELRSELRLKKEFESSLPAHILKKIVTTDSVSLHVRRGDYVSRPEAGLYHGTLSTDYYQKATGIIASKANKPVFFIFSDDLDWCRQHLPLAHETYFVGGLKNYQDLRLMSLCRRHIIANSSFSWWGAWLDPKPEKTIIAPAAWLRERNLKNSDLFPPEWIII